MTLITPPDIGTSDYIYTGEFWYSPLQKGNENIEVVIGFAHPPGIAAIYLPMLTLAAMGVWAGWCYNRGATLLLLVVPIFLTVVHTVFFSVGRYRLAAELIIYILAGIGACWGLRNLIE